MGIDVLGAYVARKVTAVSRTCQNTIQLTRWSAAPARSLATTTERAGIVAGVTACLPTPVPIMILPVVAHRA